MGFADSTTGEAVHQTIQVKESDAESQSQSSMGEGPLKFYTVWTVTKVFSSGSAKVQE